MYTQIKRLATLMMVLAVVVMAAGCAPKAAPSTSIMDTPQYHYNEGLRALDADRLAARVHRQRPGIGQEGRL
jgi:hypothetical protein